jgi:hypothetical protein
MSKGNIKERNAFHIRAIDKKDGYGSEV